MEKKISIEKLGQMVQKGFEGAENAREKLARMIYKEVETIRDEMATKTDVEEIRKDIKEIKDILLKQHDWRITQLEQGLKSIKEQFLLK